MGNAYSLLKSIIRVSGQMTFPASCMDDFEEHAAIQVLVYPVLKGVRAAADVPALMVYPDLMTEEELIVYLRILQVSSTANFKHVIDHLIRMRDLPCIHICRKRLYPHE